MSLHKPYTGCPKNIRRITGNFGFKLKYFPGFFISLILFIIPLATVPAQDIYWDSPREFAYGGAKFYDVKSTGSMVVVVWQEFVSNPGGEGGEIWLSLRSSTDAKNWLNAPRFAGPFEYTDMELNIYSLTLREDNTIAIAVATGEDTTGIYVSRDNGASFTATEIKAQFAVINPKLFLKEDGNYILFVTYGSEDSLAIYYANLRTSNFNGSSREMVFDPLVTNTDLRLNFLPVHLSHNGKEYVVFQSTLHLSEQDIIGYQIYVKISSDGGKTWGEDNLISGFEESGLTYDRFINQRPTLKLLDNRISVVWERRQSVGGYTQVYKAVLDEDGKIADNNTGTRVTRNSYNCFFPWNFHYNGMNFLLWFDNRRGKDDIFLVREGSLEKDVRNLTFNMTGNSQFARSFDLGGFIYLMWENTTRNVSHLYILETDQSVSPPKARAVNFKNGERNNFSNITVNWDLPFDPSGISSFHYSFSRIPGINESMMTEVLKSRTSESFPVIEDGTWYFHLMAEDVAGNKSEPVTLSYTRDTMPPDIVTFEDIERDEAGFLASNTFEIKWNPSGEDKDVAGYSYGLQKFPGDPDTLLLNFDWSRIQAPVKKIQTFSTSRKYGNWDNGLYGFTVMPFDDVGNAGAASTILLKLDKYIPVTIIHRLELSKDEFEVSSVRLRGRGYRVEGDIKEIYLDQDGKTPYNYTYTLDNKDYRIVNDRLIEGPVFEDVDEGVYRLIINHETRGPYVYNGLLEVPSSGNPKIYPVLPEASLQYITTPVPRYSITINTIIIGLLLLLAGLFIFASAGKTFSIVRDGKALEAEVKALVYGPGDKFWKEAQMKKLKLKGLGLGFKFTFLLSVLVILILSMVTIPLSMYMTRTQRNDLTGGLLKQVEVLLGSLSSGAQNYLPIRGELQLGLLVKNRQAMDEAVSATITGITPKDSREPTQNEYVWGTDDLNISEKILQPDDGATEIQTGLSILKDEVSKLTPALAEAINKKAIEEVSELEEDIKEMTKEAATANPEELSILSINIAKKNQQIIEKLAVIADTVNADKNKEERTRVMSVPVFNQVNMQPLYTFYKPIVYRVAGSDIYFRGMVRLEVSTEKIRTTIEDSRRQLIIQIGIISLIALGLGIIGAILLAAIIIRPIRKLAAGVARIRDTDDKSQLKDHNIVIKQKDEIRMLADTINQMTNGLVKAAAANKDLIVGKETQKMFIPLQKDESNKKGTTGEEDNKFVEIFGYYEGAKGVSGDYFDFQKLDDTHYCMIKCDVAGKGVPASLIMVEVATIFIDHFRSWNPKKPNMNIHKLVYRINDLVEERGFKGRFAALTIAIVNIQTGMCHLCNAGDKIMHVYEQAKRTTVLREMPEAPAAGVFPSMLVEMQSGFKQVKMPLLKNDTLFLWTDGLDEAKRLFRDENFEFTTCREPGLKEGDLHGDTHAVTSGDEELGLPRLYEVIDSVYNRKKYTLTKYHNPIPDEVLTFDFTKCKGTVKEAILAMISVEKVFRLYKDPSSTVEDKVVVDKKIDAFLLDHFEQYAAYFINRNEMDDHPAYVTYTHLKEDEQYDDLTVLAIRKK